MIWSLFLSLPKGWYIGAPHNNKHCYSTVYTWIYTNPLLLYSCRNAGILGGKFLERTRVEKPGSTPNHPIYYTPQDLAIGATIQVFKHQFVIMDADEYVLTYMEERADQFPPKVIELLRQTRQKTA